MALKCVCAWCQKVLRKGDEPPTHGICKKCKKRQLAKIEKLEKAA